MTVPMGLVEACRAFANGTLERKDYLQQCARRADDYEPWLKAFTYRVPADELAPAAEGPLAGIPVAVKDIISTASMPTTNGSPIYAGRIPEADAAIVTAIKAAGGTIFGKTVTTEFAWRKPGATVNPWNPAHTPGGSSSGSAAAVAVGIVPLALGSQTLGSTIRPGAYCGIVGFKPSFGSVARRGVNPLAGSLDHVGFFTRSVDDAAYALSQLKNKIDAEPDSIVLPPIPVTVDAGVEPLLSPRLALIRTAFWDKASAAQRDALEKAAAVFKSAGGVVEELSLPDAYRVATETTDRLLAAEAAAIYGPLIERFPDKTSAQLKQLVQEGAAMSVTDYLGARRLQLELRQDIAGLLNGFDAVLTLPATGEAPAGLDYTGDATFCALWTFLGTPALTLPVTRSVNGLPLGIQLAAPYRQDASLLRVAKWAEAALSAAGGDAKAMRSEQRQVA